jgi:hypothetical protein
VGRPCSVCTASSRARIDSELAGGAPLPPIAKRFRLSVDALRRHKHAHLSPALTKVAIERYGAESAATAFDSVVNRVESLVGRLESLLTLAEEKGALTGGSNVAREIRQSLELIARLRGDLDDRPQHVTVNVLQTPEFTSVVGRLVAALAPWPEARLAAADVLDVEAVEP